MQKELSEILPQVSRPGRYTGGELNEVVKPLEGIKTRFAFCFPDTYEVGMSHLGMRILYDAINRRESAYCERAFAPWVDMLQKMRENHIPLCTLETGTPLGEFDMVGFSLQYELSYTNVLLMLDLGGIPLRACDRGEGAPFVVLGGPCTYNPEPIAPFADIVVLGEGEEVLDELLDVYEAWKASRQARSAFLRQAAGLAGVYVPAFYAVEYEADGRIRCIMPKEAGIPQKVEKRFLMDMDKAPFPEKGIVPYLEPVHDRIMLEVFRGCTRGCRFCQAGMIYRPVREKSPEVLTEQACALEASTGYEEISLTSLSTGDYSRLPELAKELNDAFADKRVSLSLPSLRLDSFEEQFMQEIQKVRKSGLTFAPEAGTQRLRDVINKNITEQDLMGTVEKAFNGGWNAVKLYFMCGLPTETDEDLMGIVELAQKVKNAYYAVPKEKRAKGLRVTVSVSNFVPKPFTPFQWEGQNTMAEFDRKRALLKDALRPIRGVEFSWHDSRLSVLEAVFARGDRRLADALEKAYRLGCIFDGWSDQFNYEGWMQAFEACGVNVDFYAARPRALDEVMPWAHLSCGVSDDFFKRERERAIAAQTTPDCRSGCHGCGLQKVCGGAVK